MAGTARYSIQGDRDRACNWRQPQRESGSEGVPVPSCRVVVVNREEDVDGQDTEQRDWLLCWIRYRMGLIEEAERMQDRYSHDGILG